MVEIAIMIEGQNGLTWKHWQNIASLVETCGYIGLYRSDHFTNSNPPDLDSLELWTSLTWLASHTNRIEFGSLVSPLSFRHPAHTARMAAAVDDLSNGRLTLGIGAGWQEREHTVFGFELLSIRERFLRFEEGLEIISQLLRSDVPVNYTGKYFSINGGVLLPRPNRLGGPPILIGGNGVQRTLPLVARFGQEWNALLITPEEISRLNKSLDQHLITRGRKPEEVRRSLMTGCIFGKNQDEVHKKVNLRTKGQKSPDDLRNRGLIVGTSDEIIQQCREVAQAGVQRIMLQWLDLDDLTGIEMMANGILDELSR